jgi:hypothetical protein
MMLNQWTTRDPDLVDRADEFVPDRSGLPSIYRSALFILAANICPLTACVRVVPLPRCVRARAGLCVCRCARARPCVTLFVGSVCVSECVRTAVCVSLRACACVVVSALCAAPAA